MKALNLLQNAYFLIRHIFYEPLGISDNTPPNAREDLIRSRYSKQDQTLLCCLNPVFRVTFPVVAEFIAMGIEEKLSLLKRYIVLLAKSCFKDLWVLLVDDLELADEESISILNSFLKQNRVIAVLAYGNKLTKNFSVTYEIESTSLV